MPLSPEGGSERRLRVVLGITMENVKYRQAYASRIFFSTAG